MKQAVVLIHGIGEQKPMDTARSFVEAVLPPPEPGREQYFSKPDKVSESFELRRLQSVGRNTIHFYEYYWASHVEGTTFRHLLTWVGRLLWRRPGCVPQGLKTVWWLSWLLLGGALTAAGLGWLDGVLNAAASPTFTRASAVLLLLLAVIQGFLIYFVGDAARYLSPAPQNIALRQRIRSEGVTLLNRLHRSGEYDRIVIVGHSLGSVIGYDIITALWHQHNEVYDFTASKTGLDTLMEANLRPQPVVRDAIAALGEALKSLPESEAATDLRSHLHQGFRRAQFACWQEQRSWGNPWRITDFITLGSPLAHATMLLARSPDEFRARVRQRELPSCPPVAEGGRYAYTPAAPIVTDAGRKFSPFILHHAAAFAVTRWTNLYFPAGLGLFGDVIGGPLGRVFGPGIHDIAVTMPGVRGFTPAAHTAYWKQTAAGPLSDLKQALAFESGGDYRRQAPSLSDSDLDAILALDAALSRAERPPTVTAIGRSVLVTIVSDGTRHLRLCSKADGTWRLDASYAYAVKQ